LVDHNLFFARPARRCSSARSTRLALEAFTAPDLCRRTVLRADFVPLAVILLLILPFGHTLAWKPRRLLGAAQRLLVSIGIGIAAPPPRAPLSAEATASSRAWRRSRHLPHRWLGQRDRHALLGGGRFRC